MSFGIIVPSLDPEIQRFRALTDARDLSLHNEMARYARARGVIENLVVYPMIARQAAGTGPTVYPWGGLTRNQMTLFNGPGWTADGLTFASASSQYGSIPDFLGSETRTAFIRTTLQSATPANNYRLINQDDGGLRGWYFRVVSDGRIWAVRSGDGSNIEAYRTGAGVAITGDTTYVISQQNSANLRSVWLNKSNQSLSLFAGTNQTTNFDSDLPILIGAADTATGLTDYLSGTVRAAAFLTVNTDTTIRENLTDMINAL